LSSTYKVYFNTHPADHTAENNPDTNPSVLKLSSKPYSLQQQECVCASKHSTFQVCIIAFWSVSCSAGKYTGFNFVCDVQFFKYCYVTKRTSLFNSTEFIYSMATKSAKWSVL